MFFAARAIIFIANRCCRNRSSFYNPIWQNHISKGSDHLLPNPQNFALPIAICQPILLIPLAVTGREVLKNSLPRFENARRHKPEAQTPSAFRLTMHLLHQTIMPNFSDTYVRKAAYAYD